MSYEDFLASRVEMTVSQYLNTYLSESDRDSFKGVIKIHVYDDGMPIEQHEDNLYYVTIERSTMDFTSREECEKHLWEEFAMEETRYRN